MTKLNDIVVVLNHFFTKDAVFKGELKKVHRYRDAHDLIKKHIAGLLPKGLYYTMFEIRNTVSNIKVIGYKLDFIQYKNTYHTKGNFLAVKFQAVEGYGDMTLPEIAIMLRKYELEQNIKSTKTKLDELKKEIAEQELYLLELGKEYYSMKEVKTND